MFVRQPLLSPRSLPIRYTPQGCFYFFLMMTHDKFMHFTCQAGIDLTFDIALQKGIHALASVAVSVNDLAKTTNRLFDGIIDQDIIILTCTEDFLLGTLNIILNCSFRLAIMPVSDSFLQLIPGRCQKEDQGCIRTECSDRIAPTTSSIRMTFLPAFLASSTAVLVVP